MLSGHAGLVFSQAFAKFAITGMLSDYLSDVFDIRNADASIQIMLMEGSTSFLAIAFAFVADEHLGLYYLLLVSTASYFYGLLLFTLSIPTNFFYFYLALLLLTVGGGGHECSLKEFGEDQFASQMADDQDKASKVEFHSKAWWYMGSLMGAIAGIVVSAASFNEDDNLQMWIVGGVLSTMCMGIALFVFVAGTYCYDVRVVPHNTAFIVMLRVLVAAILRKRHLDYYSAVEEDRIKGGRMSQHSNGRNAEMDCGREGTDVGDNDEENVNIDTKNEALWLPPIVEKASSNATACSNAESKWRLCTQTDVEGTKILLRLFPTWTTLLIFGLFKSMISSFFIQQANEMDTVAVGNFALPATIFYAITFLPQILGAKACISLFTLVFGRNYRRTLGGGLILGTLCCFTASWVEARRLEKVKSLNYTTAATAQSWGFLFWLVPQFFLAGAMNGFLYVGISEFFHDEVPQQFRNFKSVFLQSIFALGSWLGALSVVVSNRATGWFEEEIDESRLDRYYVAMGIIGLFSLSFYLCVGIPIRSRNAENATGNGSGSERDEETEIKVELAIPIE
ncbi:hypothetical protein ACLOJK_012433 [Asimina triloba]